MITRHTFLSSNKRDNHLHPSASQFFTNNLTLLFLFKILVGFYRSAVTIGTKSNSPSHSRDQNSRQLRSQHRKIVRYTRTTAGQRMHSTLSVVLHFLCAENSSPDQESTQSNIHEELLKCFKSDAQKSCDLQKTGLNLQTISSLNGTFREKLRNIYEPFLP